MFVVQKYSSRIIIAKIIFQSWFLSLLLLVSSKMGINNAITTAAQNNDDKMMSCCFAAHLHASVSPHVGGKSQKCSSPLAR